MLSRYTYTSDERFRAIHKVSSHPFHFQCKNFCLLFQYFLSVILIFCTCHFNIFYLLFQYFLSVISIFSLFYFNIRHLSFQYFQSIISPQGPVRGLFAANSAGQGDRVVVVMMIKKQIMIKKETNERNISCPVVFMSAQIENRKKNIFSADLRQRSV